MATLSEDPGKRGNTFRVGFMNADRKRKTVRLGAMPKKKAENIRGHVDQLEACLFDGSAPPVKTAAWLADVGDVLRGRMEKAGLVGSSEKIVIPTLVALIDQYRSRPAWKSLKPATVKAITQSIRDLLLYFGSERRIDRITELAAEDFAAHLLAPKEAGGRELAKSTVLQIDNFAHRLFRFAIRQRFMDSNPFENAPRGNCLRGNNVFVTREEVAKVMAQMPNSEFRLMLGLSRFGALRVPSETNRLRWADVDWAGKKFLVRSPKTERHEGKESRWVPIFPELMPLLQERWDEAGEGEELVLPSIAKHPNNSGTVRNAVIRAGLRPWSRLFHSCRSSRQTELEQQYPTYVVCEWCGNSVNVARRHYLQVTESHFATAAQIPAQTPSATVRHGEPIAFAAMAK
ncbi:tyrosine-type recombinase/integrase [Lacipirellula parvula]|uniref:Uncharacterized protein n=1 Tax=Lacipirellula parvula TaxID=2650471 RepID=A0A5K7XIG2_9BACT|nr:site-specific integrase [Lacipirellula parvula]BBO34751.1 hypothetical protein PLANPX_4363 [Lacipirellula parvula]